MVKGKGVISSEGKTRSPLPGISMGNQKPEIRWQTPNSGWVKLNTDASFISTNDAGSGIVLHDLVGNIIAYAIPNANFKHFQNLKRGRTLFKIYYAYK